MFKALSRLDSFIAQSDSWEGQNLEKWLQHKPTELHNTKTKEDAMDFLHKYGSKKNDKPWDRGYMSAGTRQPGRFVSIRVPGV